MRNFKITFIVLIILFLLTSCLDISNFKEIGKINKDELTIYLGAISEPEMGFDPILGWACVDGVSIFHSYLLKYDYDMNIVNDLVKEYHISDDKLTYTFYLRDDVLFSDGSNLTSEDVKFTYKKAIEENIIANLDSIDKIETPDLYTTIINLKTANSLFIDTVTRLGIVSKDAYNNNYYKIPIGSGPYKLQNWEKGNSLTAIENPYFYGKKPSITKIKVLFCDESEAFIEARKNKLDFYAISRKYANENIPTMNLLHFKSADIINIPFPTVKLNKIKRSDGLIVGNDITSNVAIRRALCIGINRQDIVDDILLQYGSPAYDLVVPDMPWYNSETVYKDNDVQCAKKLLADDGWLDFDGDGIVEKNGVKAEFDIYAPNDNKLYQDIAYIVSKQAIYIGIKINVKIDSWTEIDKLRYSNPYVVLWGAMSPIDIFYLNYSKNSGNGYFNSGYYRNKEVDYYIENALSAKNLDRQYYYWKKAQWDGEVGFSQRGDAVQLWIASVDHIFRIKDGLNIGKQGIQNASNGWAILHNIEYWKWD